MFGKADVLLERLSERLYSLTILCAPDFAFVQDGTRQPEGFRLRQHDWYLTELKRRNISFLLVSGTIEKRIAAIQKHLFLNPVV
jgi:nicotinamide riboside kinase